MSRFWNKKTASLTPYVAGEQPLPGQKVIKLNTNENPYPPSPCIKEHMLGFDPAVLRRYPELTSRSLREAIADFYGVRPEQVFCGNGSDEVLAFSFQAFFETEKDGLYAELTFLVPIGENCEVQRVRLTSARKLDKDNLCGAPSSEME